MLQSTFYGGGNYTAMEAGSVPIFKNPQRPEPRPARAFVGSPGPGSMFFEAQQEDPMAQSTYMHYEGGIVKHNMDLGSIMSAVTACTLVIGYLFIIPFAVPGCVHLMCEKTNSTCGLAPVFDSPGFPCVRALTPPGCSRQSA